MHTAIVLLLGAINAAMLLGYIISLFAPEESPEKSPVGSPARIKWDKAVARGLKQQEIYENGKWFEQYKILLVR